MTEHPNTLTVLLNAARRRHLSQVTIEQTVIAAGAALAGAVFLLLLGTQVLDWYWLVLLAAGSFGLGLWRTLRRTPSRYRLAQIIDARLRLHDTLSTALYYESGSRKADPELLVFQHDRAESLARTIDPAAVFPLRVPKVLYAVGGVALVAFGMFAIRYGITHTLDLKPSLVKIAFDTFWKQDRRAADVRQKSPLQKKLEDQLKKLGINVGSPDAQPKDQDAKQDTAANALDGPDLHGESSDNAQAKVQSSPNEQTPDPDGSEKGERASGSEDQSGDNQPPDAQGLAQSNNQQVGQKGDQQNGDKSSMMDRMRDAMANLLNKLKMQPKGNESRQMAQDSKSGGRGQQQKGQKGSPNPGKPDANGSPSPDQQGQDQGQGEHNQQAQGKNGSKADHQPSQDAKSGIGKDDGDKTAREAEQLAAMGKISEILGKRAQNMSGELMVEVAGGNQQLKTQYSGIAGKHAEAGGEISRDEVPLIYRDFVQQYFERVRKAPPAGAKTKAAEVTNGKKAVKVSE